MKPKVEKSSVNSWDKLWSSFDEKKGYGYQLTLEEHRVRWQRIQETILNKYGTFSGLECIEIGAGSGSYSILFSRRGARVTKLDYSEKALALCKQIFKKQGILSTQVNFLLMDALKWMNIFLGNSIYQCHSALQNIFGKKIERSSLKIILGY